CILLGKRRFLGDFPELFLELRDRLVEWAGYDDLGRIVGLEPEGDPSFRLLNDVERRDQVVEGDLSSAGLRLDPGDGLAVLGEVFKGLDDNLDRFRLLRLLRPGRADG